MTTGFQWNSAHLPRIVWEMKKWGEKLELIYFMYSSPFSMSICVYPGRHCVIRLVIQFVIA